MCIAVSLTPRGTACTRSNGITFELETVPYRVCACVWVCLLVHLRRANRERTLAYAFAGRTRVGKIAFNLYCKFQVPSTTGHARQCTFCTRSPPNAIRRGPPSLALRSAQSMRFACVCGCCAMVSKCERKFMCKMSEFQGTTIHTHCSEPLFGYLMGKNALRIGHLCRVGMCMCMCVWHADLAMIHSCNLSSNRVDGMHLRVCVSAKDRHKFNKCCAI